jgi:hypothetical protein
MLLDMSILAPSRPEEAAAWTETPAVAGRAVLGRPDGRAVEPATADMGAWWRRKDRPEDRRTPSAPPARQRPGPEADSEPPVSEAPAPIRLGRNVLPEAGRAPRRPAVAPAAPNTGRGPSAGPAQVDTGSGTSDADQHVRRALALAELSMLVLDQD